MIEVAMVGGSGLVGRMAAARLATRDDVDLVSFVRGEPATAYERSLDFEGLLHDGGELLGLERVDVAISCLGTTMRQAGSKGAFRRVDYDYVYAFARATRRFGARQFILISSAGASRSAFTYYLSLKAEVESVVARLDFERVDVIRPGLLIGNRREFRPTERMASAVAPWLGPLLQGANRRYRPTLATRVADAIADLAGVAAPGRYLYENPELDLLQGR